MVHRATIAVAFLMLIAAFTISSCGQKSAEQEAQEQQQHDDSLKAAIIAEMNQKMQPVDAVKKTSSNSPNDDAANGNSSGNSPNQNASDLVTRRQASHLALADCM